MINLGTLLFVCSGMQSLGETLIKCIRFKPSDDRIIIREISVCISTFTLVVGPPVF